MGFKEKLGGAPKDAFAGSLSRYARKELQLTERRLTRLGIADALGLESAANKRLASLYLSQRMLRWGISEDESYLRNPFVEAAGRLPVARTIVTLPLWGYPEDLKKLSELKAAAEKFAKDNYSKVSNKPRAIELAINMLVAGSTVEVNGKSSFQPNPGILNDVAERWRPSLQAS